jgi:hypothetical protein
VPPPQREPSVSVVCVCDCSLQSCKQNEQIRRVAGLRLYIQAAFVSNGVDWNLRRPMKSDFDLPLFSTATFYWAERCRCTMLGQGVRSIYFLEHTTDSLVCDWGLGNYACKAECLVQFAFLGAKVGDDEHLVASVFTRMMCLRIEPLK